MTVEPNQGTVPASEGFAGSFLDPSPPSDPETFPEREAEAFKTFERLIADKTRPTEYPGLIDPDNMNAAPYQVRLSLYLYAYWQCKLQDHVNRWREERRQP